MPPRCDQRKKVFQGNVEGICDECTTGVMMNDECDDVGIGGGTVTKKRTCKKSIGAVSKCFADYIKTRETPKSGSGHQYGRTGNIS